MGTRLGGQPVQVSAPEAREALERGVADAITFPWGPILLFGIDKSAKYRSLIHILRCRRRERQT